MTERSDYTVQYASSPRQVVVDDPSTEFIAQDVIDTLANEQAKIDALDDDQLMAASGKENLGSGQTVGLTVTLQNTQIGFEMPIASTENGTITTTDTSGRYLDDSAATFQTLVVNPGDAIINFTTQAWGTVSRVISETRIETTVQRMVGGTSVGFTSADVYKVIPTKQCDVSGGNVVAIDDVEAEISSIFPSAFTQINKTSSSSATSSEIAEIRLASYQNAVWYKAGSGNSGTDYPVGNRANPVDNVTDTVAIAQQSDKAFEEIRAMGDITIDASDNIDGFEVWGQSPSKSTITLVTGCSTIDSEFFNASLTGNAEGAINIIKCHIFLLEDVGGTLNDTNIHNTIFEDAGVTITLSSTATEHLHIIDCYSGVAGTDTPILDINGCSMTIVCRNYAGGLEVRNYTSGNTSSWDFLSGQIIFDSTCTNGIAVVRGACKITDNSTGSFTVVDETTYFSTTFGSYQGAICIDSTSSNTGTEYPIGTGKFPVNNLADAKTLASFYGILNMIVFNTLTIGATDVISGYNFIGGNNLTSVMYHLAGCTTEKTRYRDMIVLGSINGPVYMENVGLQTISNIGSDTFPSIFYQCILRRDFIAPLTGDVALKFKSGLTTPQNVHFIDCASGVPGTDAATMDMNSTECAIAIRKYGGGITFKNMTIDNDHTVEIDQGQATFESTCTASTIRMGGIYKLTNDGNVTLEARDFSVAQAIWDTVLTGNTFNLTNSAGRRMRELGNVIQGSVNDASASTTIFITNLTETVSSFYAGQLIRFTSGILEGQTKPILSYNGSTKEITLQDALTSAPDDGVDFDIVPAHVHAIDEIVDGIWNEPASNRMTAGTMGFFLNLIKAYNTNRMDIDEAGSRIIIYDEVGTSPLYYNVIKDKDGLNITLTGTGPANRLSRT